MTFCPVIDIRSIYLFINFFLENDYLYSIFFFFDFYNKSNNNINYSQTSRKFLSHN